MGEGGELEVHHHSKEEEGDIGEFSHRSVIFLQGRIRSTHMDIGRQSNKPEGTEEPTICSGDTAIRD